jgi:hypothetical protein
VVPDKVQDLGLVPQGSERVAEFRLVNRSRDDLELLGATTSCSCTSANLGRNRLAPGESTTIALTFHSGHSRGRIAIEGLLGYRSATAPDVTRTLTLHASGVIDPDFDVHPESLTFNADGPLRQSITLKPRRVSTLDVLSVQGDKRFLKTEILSTRPDEVIVAIEYLPERHYPDAGPASVLILTDAPHEPRHLFPVRVSPTSSPQPRTTDSP